MKSSEKSLSFTAGLKDGLPICLGYVSVSFAFGIFTINTGLTAWQAVVISMTTVTSAGQLAGVPIIAYGLPMIEMALSQLVINLRYALMSISLSQKLAPDVTFFDRFLIAFVNTDEIFAVASGKSGLVSRYYFFGLMITPYFGWAIGTALGAIAGNILPDIVTSALGIGIYGMFIAIIIPAAKKNLPIAGVVAVSSVLSILFKFVPLLSHISRGFVIIICAVTSILIFTILSPVGDTND